ncbi:hypothetical protein Gotri_021678 [Gossypium trilobum]|uniref:Translocon-associated protein subunit beta n=1 Tax=Gossypium trilobum TaxID=34281 RepID=A0A7J9DE20_9ROSI|nr:hypothetical protein [Gossypium trilobum]
METVIGNPLIKALIILFLLSATTAAGDAPFIISHKKASLTRLKSGAERVSVSIDIYNQGFSCVYSLPFSTAYDVSLVDDSWPKDLFDIISGNTSNSWERLDAGGILSHSFEIDAKRQGMFHGAPAVITYRVPTKVSLQEAYSTPILPLDILAERPTENKLDWLQRLLAKYGSQLSVVSIVLLFIYLVATPSKASAAKASKKKR